ncbi:11553_t:CDS:2 [Ambispora gerdemannii]|uniref:11553_t:CDS:1 n=1 Tax=Ambispora gerdemannii TaxID=144530 RepID=A0A9N8VNN6_9GLOM|nr:11553_t:CDS:2 [Ambispora gerdemannii]
MAIENINNNEPEMTEPTTSTINFDENIQLSHKQPDTNSDNSKISTITFDESIQLSHQQPDTNSDNSTTTVITISLDNTTQPEPEPDNLASPPPLSQDGVIQTLNEVRQASKTYVWTNVLYRWPLVFAYLAVIGLGVALWKTSTKFNH